MCNSGTQNAYNCFSHELCAPQVFVSLAPKTGRCSPIDRVMSLPHTVGKNPNFLDHQLMHLKYEFTLVHVDTVCRVLPLSRNPDFGHPNCQEWGQGHGIPTEQRHSSEVILVQHPALANCYCAPNVNCVSPVHMTMDCSRQEIGHYFWGAPPVTTAS